MHLRVRFPHGSLSRGEDDTRDRPAFGAFRVPVRELRAGNVGRDCARGKPRLAPHGFSASSGPAPIRGYSFRKVLDPSILRKPRYAIPEPHPGPWDNERQGGCGGGVNPGDPWRSPGLHRPSQRRATRLAGCLGTARLETLLEGTHSGSQKYLTSLPGVAAVDSRSSA